MIDLSICIGLSVIGLETIGNGFDDLNNYGHLVFRCKENSELSDEFSWSKQTIQSLITKSISISRLNLSNVGIISISENLQNFLFTSGIEINLHKNLLKYNNLAYALITANDWLDGGDVDAVIIVDEHLTTKSLSAIVVCTAKFAADNQKPVLANFAGLMHSESSTMSLADTLKKAFDSGPILPVSIELLLLSGSLKTSDEMKSPHDLIAAFSSSTSKSCALADGGGRLQSVVKAVWCLNQRVIPGSQNWDSPENPRIWNDSSFYIPTESRTWFRSSEQPDRFATVIDQQNSSSYSVFVLQESNNTEIRVNSGLSLESYVLFPIYGNSTNELTTKLEKLKTECFKQNDLPELSNIYLRQLQTESTHRKFTLCILGHTPEELNREIDFAVKGIQNAIDKNIDWRTPMGSYLTSTPLGDSGSISFVYPGAFNSYPGVGRDLFYLFPSLYDRISSISSNLSALLNEKMLYPRSISALSGPDLEKAEKDLSTDPLAMLISGTSLAALYTFLLTGTLGIQPISAIGYSLGEISMMFASEAWTKADETSAALRASPLFKTRLAGPQNAVRENWNLPIVDSSHPDELLWANYVLMAAPEAVNTVLKDVQHVYLTHINTPRQVVIGGDPAACRQVIDCLKCNVLQAPFNYALHCEAMQSEFADLEKLHTWPVNKQPGMTLYSAATYAPMPIEQTKIASQIAYGLSHQLDFPRLITQAYIDGARIFIELGAGSNCARWVDESLKELPHAAFSINRKGVDDHTAVLQLLAKLISHHVPINLSALIS